MEIKIDETQAKELIKEVVLELITERQDLFLELFVGTIEDIGLANAIREGQMNDFIREDQVTSILEGRS